jgi:hypothetical protein
MPSAEKIARQYFDQAHFDEDRRVAACVDALKRLHGPAVAAVVLYGSYLRGSADTLLDLYVLLDRYASALPAGQALANRLLPPNVYHLALTEFEPRLAAKYATVTIDRLEAAVGNDFHSYFWARFAQPVAPVYVRDDAVRARLVDIVCTAVGTMVRRVAPMLPSEFSTRDLWIRGFTLTYGCELRSEDAGKATELYERYQDYLAPMTAAVAHESGLSGGDGEHWRAETTAVQRRSSRRRWWLRRGHGKALSLARLAKAAFTFNDPLEYILWKIERHSGVYIEPTDLQRRYPVFFSWGLFWRLYRRGGFK